MRLTSALFALAGVGLVAGGLAHPQVGADPAATMRTAATHAAWVPAHLGLTVAQLLAFAGVALACAQLASRPRLAPTFAAGVALVLLGTALGALGTLGAATGVRVAAESGDAAVFGAIASLDLAVGWLCLVATTIGGALVGAGAAAQFGGRGRGFALATTVGSLAALAATLATPPTHWATHQVLLRGGALLFGAVLLALAARWPRIYSLARGGT